MAIVKTCRCSRAALDVEHLHDRAKVQIADIVVADAEDERGGRERRTPANPSFLSADRCGGRLCSSIKCRPLGPAPGAGSSCSSLSSFFGGAVRVRYLSGPSGGIVRMVVGTGYLRS